VERALDRVAAARDRPRVELVGPVREAVEPVDARRREREQPANVLGRDEMPRRAHDVRPEDFARVERSLDLAVARALQSLAERPPGPAVVLCLNGAEPADDLRHPPEPDSGKPLIIQSFTNEPGGVCGHAEADSSCALLQQY